MKENYLPPKLSYSHIYAFCIFLFLVAFIYDRPKEIWEGLVIITTSPSNLLTDYIEIGGIGAAFFNSGIITLASTLLLKKNRVELSGIAIAGLITMCGFAFFGKNMYNSIPITLGVFLYAYLKRIPFKEVAVISLFATALSPFVSEIKFSMGLSSWSGFLLSYGAGMIIGFIIPPLAASFVDFHHGYNLYNIGFTAGVVGMFATGILRMFNLQVQTTSILSGGNNFSISVVLLIIIAGVFLLGLSFNDWSFSKYAKLMRHSGRLKTDFIALFGEGITLINVAIMGLISWAYVLLVGGELNGPTIGAIFTVMGFSAFGNHPRNTIPIFIGTFLASLLNMHETYSTVAVIATLFGSTLAPIAGQFGVLAGIAAGFFHVSMAYNISYLHGGMNLYNNGFSGGFVAATLVPILASLGECVKRFKSR
ncbi:MAG: DUF1576 domain-containing protein [Clostridia bacterium]|nr:DUF1576 domain-containing protein [Clostridia bacterium]